MKPAHSGFVFSARALATLAWLIATPVIAVERHWADGNGGSFNNIFNWVGSVVPTAADTAIFDVAGFYTVTFPTDKTTDRVLIRSGMVTFSLGAMEYALLNSSSLNPSIVVGLENDNAWLTITGGMSGKFTDVGQLADAFGGLTLDGAGASLINEFHLHIGDQGSGTLEVLNGALVSNTTAALGQAMGAVGEAVVDGTGSLWTCLGDLAVGKAGVGSLTIDDGAGVVADQAIVAQTIDSFGDAVVRGKGSIWQVADTLDVGMSGFGSLTIEDGGVVNVGGFAIFGTFPAGKPWKVPGEGGVGEAFIDGAGSTLDVGGDLHIGFFHNGRAVLGRGGRAIVGGDLFRGAWPYATPPQMTIQFGSSGDYLEPAFDITGQVEAFSATVELVDGLAPAIGDEFQIVSASNITGPWVFTLPPLPPDRQWLVDQDVDSVTLRVICVHPSDVTEDGAINVDDLLAVINAWGPCAGGCPPACAADINGDCSVGVDDLLEVIAAWGACK